jgi:hypothetical protein
MASRQSRKNSVGRYQAGQGRLCTVSARYPVGLHQLDFVSGPDERFATTSAITKSGRVRTGIENSGPLRAEHASFASAPFWSPGSIMLQRRAPQRYDWNDNSWQRHRELRLFSLVEAN